MRICRASHRAEPLVRRRAPVHVSPYAYAAPGPEPALAEDLPAVTYVVLENWTSPGQPHSMQYESEAILEFFGLNEIRCLDPQVEACSKK